MCGIAGIIYLNETEAELATISKMTECMRHRGPDADGFFVKDNIALGHRRLSIIDLSTASNQPFADKTNRFQLIFNGELYNFQQVRDTITDHHFRTTGDTEVLVEAYARWGINCIHHFKGMFAFAVWDDTEKELCIVRDRMGVKPVYYYTDNNFLVFASEIRSILKSGLVAPLINKNALVDYLSFQSISSPNTLIKGIRQLEAGHYISVKNNSVEIKQYWSLTEKTEEGEFTDTKAVQQKIKDLLSNSVKSRLISDVPIGAFLSGGIDSSAVVGLMSRLGNGRPLTFNISFDEKEFDESIYAEIVAKKFNTVHQRIVLKPRILLDELENALNALDTPSGDGINTYVLSKVVKQAGLTVALSGIGGDELFAGYPLFKTFYHLNKNRRTWSNTKPLRQMAAPMVSVVGSYKAVKAAELLNSSSSEIEEMYSIFRHVLSENQIEKVLTGHANFSTPLQQKLEHNAAAIHQFPLLSQVSIAEYMGYTQQTLLKDIDQMSMSVSLEVREPFFDHELIRYVLNIPDELKYPRYPKSLLVESLNGLLPERIVYRKKQGFTFPWSHWLRNELHAFCQLHIDRLCERQFINGKILRSMWNDFQAGSK
ncbi:MAG: asparagine synthase (glutamine-hydrolyzing), partial [Flavitalea sp.]